MKRYSFKYYLYDSFHGFYGDKESNQPVHLIKNLGPNVYKNMRKINGLFEKGYVYARIKSL